MNSPGAASGSPVPGRGVDGAAAPATGPALSSAVWAIRAWHVLRLSFVVAAVLGVGLVMLSGCAAPPQPNLIGVGAQLSAVARVVAAQAYQLDAVPVPVPVVGTPSCPLPDPDHDGVLCND